MPNTQKEGSRAVRPVEGYACAWHSITSAVFEGQKNKFYFWAEEGQFILQVSTRNSRQHCSQL
jgi:hypothetical protein